MLRDQNYTFIKNATITIHFSISNRVARIKLVVFWTVYRYFVCKEINSNEAECVYDL